MDSTFGDFQMEETNGKQYLVYHLDDNSDEQKMSSEDIDNNNLSVSSTTFLCPALRFKLVVQRMWRLFYFQREGVNYMNRVEIDCSPYFNIESLNDKYKRKRLDLKKRHYVFPLFWCKNKDYDHHRDGDRTYNRCKLCARQLNIDTDYYFCVKCDRTYHKECVESPVELNHPYHLNHALKFLYFEKGVDCDHCGAKEASNYAYHCTLCNVSIHTVCALKPIPFVMEQTKRHDHPLTFFTRIDPLRCNVCGLVKKTHPTYVCLKCDFVSHKDCADFPSVIRISRHHHRIYFTSSLQPGKWSCGVCRKNIDSKYGTYTCKKCEDYVVHPICALRKDIWDGKELDGVPEEDDIEEILEPFKTISEGLILHFLHKHCLKSEISGDVYDDRKNCHACALPIYEGKFYSCMKCGFLLHDDCANAPRKKQHPLHPHSLTLKATIGYLSDHHFQCDACCRENSGFVYECNIKKNCFRLDVRCGSISEPFVYQGHKHPLFLALDPQEKHLCQVCQKDDKILMNCIECDFIICLKCVSLPYMAKYKHDNHLLTLVHGKEIDDPNWCEVCEKLLILSPSEKEDDEVKPYRLGDNYEEFYKTKRKKERGEDIKDNRFYQCKRCCTTLHINCLLGKLPYMRPGHRLDPFTKTALNSSPSRPFCHRCDDRIVDKIYYKTDGTTVCCLNHLF